MYEDVVIENYGIPVVITDVLVRKHKSTGRNMYINHPDSIHKIEKGAQALITPIGAKKAIVEFEWQLEEGKKEGTKVIDFEELAKELGI